MKPQIQGNMIQMIDYLKEMCLNMTETKLFKNTRCNETVETRKMQGKRSRGDDVCLDI